MKNAVDVRLEANAMRLLATLLAAGVSITDALNIVADGFEAFEKPFRAIRGRIIEGFEFPDAIKGQQGSFSSFVPPLLSYEKLPEAIWKAASILDSNVRMVRAEVQVQEINKMNFYHLLGNLLRFGCPIIAALKIAGDEYLPAEGTEKLVEALRKGDTIVSGLEKVPDHYFSSSDRKLILVGECIGAVPDVCDKLAELQEWQVLLENGRGRPYSEHDADALSAMSDYDSLALLLKGGLPLNHSLKILASNASTHSMQSAFERLFERSKDLPFGEAIKSGDFPLYVVEIVGARLEPEKAFKLIADHLKWELLGVKPEFEFDAVTA